MPFLGSLEHQFATSNGRNFRTLDLITYICKNGERIEIPIGTLTDGASIPQEFWNILPPFGVYWLACVLHDFLYNSHPKPAEMDDESYRRWCDTTLLEAMESLNVPFIIRITIYEGVRYGGQHAYTEDRLKMIADYIKDSEIQIVTA